MIIHRSEKQRNIEKKSPLKKHQQQKQKHTRMCLAMAPVALGDRYGSEVVVHDALLAPPNRPLPFQAADCFGQQGGDWRLR